VLGETRPYREIGKKKNGGLPDERKIIQIREACGRKLPWLILRCLYLT
jgi:hypothetical protein